MNAKGRTLRRRLLRATVAFVALLLIAAVAVPLLVPAERWKDLAFEQLRARTGLVGRAEKASVSLFPLGLRLSRLSLEDSVVRPQYDRLEIDIDAVVVRASLGSILRRAPEVAEIRLLAPSATVRLVEPSAAVTDSAPPPPMSLALALLSIDDGRLDLTDAEGGRTVLEGLRSRLRLDVRGDRAVGRIEGAFTALSLASADTSVPPVLVPATKWKAAVDASTDGARVALTELELEIDGAKAAGTLDYERRARPFVRTSLAGNADLRTLWTGPLAPQVGPALAASGFTARDLDLLSGTGRFTLSMEGELDEDPKVTLTLLRADGDVADLALRTFGREDLVRARADFALAGGRLSFTGGRSEGTMGMIEFVAEVDLRPQVPRLTSTLRTRVESGAARELAGTLWPRLSELGLVASGPDAVPPSEWPRVAGAADVRLELDLPLEPAAEGRRPDPDSSRWQVLAKSLRVEPVELTEALEFIDLEVDGNVVGARVRKGRVQGAGLDADLSLTLGGWPESNRIEGRVTGHAVDLDRLKAALAPAKETAWLDGVLVGVAHAASAAAAAPDSNLSAFVDWTAAAVRTTGYTLTEAKGRVELVERRLKILDTGASLGGGKVRAAGEVDWNVDPPHWKGDARAEKVGAGELVRPFAGLLADALSSTVSGDLSLDGPVSEVPAQVLASLSGQASVLGAAGHVLTEPLLGPRISTFLGEKAAQWRQLDFSDLTADLRIAGGRVHFEKFVLRGRTELLAKGSIGLDGSSDYRLDVKLPEGVVPQLGALAPVADLLRDPDGRFSFGVDVGGPAKSPRVEIDFAQLEARAKGAGKDRLREALDEQKDRLAPQKAAADSIAKSKTEELQERAKQGIGDLLKRRKGGGGAP